MTFLDKYAQSFREFCKSNQLWSVEKSSNSKVTLVESPATRANLLGIRLHLGAATKKFKSKVLLYRVAPATRLLRIRELLRFYFSFERAMGIYDFKNIVW